MSDPIEYMTSVELARREELYNRAEIALDAFEGIDEIPPKGAVKELVEAARVVLEGYVDILYADAQHDEAEKLRAALSPFEPTGNTGEGEEP
jgi:hypothetical protein